MAQPSKTGAPTRPFMAVMDVILVLVALAVLRLIIGFFGPLAASVGGAAYLSLTRHLIPPLAASWSVSSPYGGVFSVDAAILIVVLLAAEWLLSVASSRSTPERPDTEG